MKDALTTISNQQDDMANQFNVANGIEVGSTITRRPSPRPILPLHCNVVEADTTFFYRFSRAQEFGRIRFPIPLTGPIGVDFYFVIDEEESTILLPDGSQVTTNLISLVAKDYDLYFTASPSVFGFDPGGRDYHFTWFCPKYTDPLLVFTQQKFVLVNTDGVTRLYLPSVGHIIYIWQRYSQFAEGHSIFHVVHNKFSKLSYAGGIYDKPQLYLLRSGELPNTIYS